jgi:hypothetical protein
MIKLNKKKKQNLRSQSKDFGTALGRPLSNGTKTIGSKIPKNGKILTQEGMLLDATGTQLTAKQLSEHNTQMLLLQKRILEAQIRLLEAQAAQARQLSYQESINTLDKGTKTVSNIWKQSSDKGSDDGKGEDC